MSWSQAVIGSIVLVSTGFALGILLLLRIRSSALTLQEDGVACALILLMVLYLIITGVRTFRGRNSSIPEKSESDPDTPSGEGGEPRR